MKKSKKQIEDEEKEKIKEQKEEMRTKKETQLKEKTSISYVVTRRRR